jgi:hypothetical protein
MNEACKDINPDLLYVRLEIHRSKMFFTRCMNNEDIYCDVNENQWSNVQDRLDANLCLLNVIFL